MTRRWRSVAGFVGASVAGIVAASAWGCAAGAGTVASAAAASPSDTDRSSPPNPSVTTVTALRDSVRALLERAYADSAFPGAYAVVGNHRGVMVQMGVGRLDWAESPRPDENTLYDMASLTKVVALTSALMQLTEAGKVQLDAPVQRYVPEFTRRNKDRVTVRQLLTHSSGLVNWRPLYKETFTPELARALAIATELDTVPGVRMSYSDLGAIVLGVSGFAMHKVWVGLGLGTVLACWAALAPGGGQG